MALWARAADRFSPHKALERTSPVNGLVEVVVFMLCVAVFLSPAVLGSFVLEHRFVDMILATPIEADRNEVRNLEQDAVYPQGLVERYTNLDYETYLEYSETDKHHVGMNYLIQAKINSLYKVASGQDEEWQEFLIGMIFMLHLGGVMFISKHVNQDLLVKTFIYGCIAVVLIGILEVVGIVVYEYFCQGNFLNESNFIKAYTRSLLILMSLGSIFFSLKIFWQKSRRMFTAVNITLLPYVVFGLQYVILDIIAEHNDAIDHLLYYKGFPTQLYGDSWDEVIKILIFGTPILILWVFIPLKAMYTRLLALPEG